MVSLSQSHELLPSGTFFSFLTNNFVMKLLAAILKSKVPFLYRALFLYFSLSIIGCFAELLCN